MWYLIKSRLLIRHAKTKAHKSGRKKLNSIKKAYS